MVIALVILVVAIAVVGLVVFFRAVFGGSTFRRPRGKRKDDGGGRPGSRPDSHAGASTWTGGGGSGRWGTWSSDS